VFQNSKEMLLLQSRGGQLVFDWDRLENFLITRDVPVGNKVTSRKYKIQSKGILIEKYSFQVPCQFNAKSGAIDQLKLGDRPADRHRSVGHPGYALLDNPHNFRLVHAPLCLSNLIVPISMSFTKCGENYLWK